MQAIIKIHEITVCGEAFYLYLKIRNFILEFPQGGSLELYLHVFYMTSCVCHFSLLVQVFPCNNVSTYSAMVTLAFQYILAVTS